jgi:hypothetical protein
MCFSLCDRVRHHNVWHAFQCPPSKPSRCATIGEATDNDPSGPPPACLDRYSPRISPPVCPGCGGVRAITGNSYSLTPNSIKSRPGLALEHTLTPQPFNASNAGVAARAALDHIRAVRRGAEARSHALRCQMTARNQRSSSEKSTFCQFWTLSKARIRSRYHSATLSTPRFRYALPSAFRGGAAPRREYATPRDIWPQYGGRCRYRRASSIPPACRRTVPIAALPRR